MAAQGLGGSAGAAAAGQAVVHHLQGVEAGFQMGSEPGRAELHLVCHTKCVGVNGAQPLCVVIPFWGMLTGHCPTLGCSPVCV